MAAASAVSMLPLPLRLLALVPLEHVVDGGPRGDVSGVGFPTESSIVDVVVVVATLVNPGEELRQALLLSLQESGGSVPAAAADKDALPAKPPDAAAKAPEASAPAAAPAPSGEAAALLDGMDMDDMDEELKQALLLSMQDAEAAPAQSEKAAAPAEPAKAPASAAPTSGEKAGDEVDPKWYQDPAFMSDLLGSLPGVDINDPRIQSALKEVGGDKEEDKKDGDKKDGDASGSGGK